MRARIAQGALLGLLSLAPLQMAQAESPAGFVDGYYLPWTQLKVDAGDDVDGDVDGDGWGVKGLLKLNDQIAFNGEYQRSDYDGPSKLDSYRLGAGYYWRYFGATAEYINLNIDSGDIEGTADGVGLFLRTSWLATSGLAFTGGIGYVRLDDGGETLDGLEYNLGLDFRITSNLGVFADYRSTDLTENGVDFELNDARVGLRFVFGV
jgi:opacity protein-like surface antigen